MSATKGLTLKYEERLVDLEEFLRLDIPADVKKRVWDENKVSDAIYQRKRPVDTVKILQILEKWELLDILKELKSNEHFRDHLNSGLLYDILIHLRPGTVKALFADADLTFCDHGELYSTLRKLIKEQNVDAVECCEQMFQQVFKHAKSLGEKDLSPHALIATDEMDSILRLSSDYLVCVFIRYFQAVPLQRKYSRLTGFALLTQQTYLMYHKQISKNDDDINGWQAKDDNSAVLWQRFLRCLITVDTDLTFLDEPDGLPEYPEWPPGFGPG